MNVEDKKTWITYRENRLLTRRDLELNFSIARTIYLMIILVTFRVADREISDPVEIANGFCDYFTNLGPSLAGKIPTSNKPFCSFLKSDVVNSVFFPSTYQQEIVEICASLRSGSAAGFDKIFI